MDCFDGSPVRAMMSQHEHFLSALCLVSGVMCMHTGAFLRETTHDRSFLKLPEVLHIPLVFLAWADPVGVL